MINIFLALSLALFSFEMFSITSKVSNLNKTMLNIPMAVFSSSVPLLPGETYTFDKLALEERLNNYFSTNIIPYVNNYKINYTYYDSALGSICMSDSCSRINIRLSANIDGLYNYHRVMEYTIGEGNG